VLARAVGWSGRRGGSWVTHGGRRAPSTGGAGRRRRWSPMRRCLRTLNRRPLGGAGAAWSPWVSSDGLPTPARVRQRLSSVHLGDAHSDRADHLVPAGRGGV